MKSDWFLLLLLSPEERSVTQKKANSFGDFHFSDIISVQGYEFDFLHQGPI